MASLADSPCVEPLPTDACLQLPLGAPGVLLAVSDGIGGSRAGEVASALSLLTLNRLLCQPRVGSEFDWLLASIRATDDAVRAAAAADPSKDGMGATLTALWLDGTAGWLIHVGDSRLYRFRDGQLKQLSTDHSPVGRMRIAGEIDEEQARNHHFRNIVDQSLGGPAHMFVPEILAVDFRSGDVLMLCTDGLTDGMSGKEIAACLFPLAAGAAQPAVACRALIAAGNAASGRDNLTVVVGRLT